MKNIAAIALFITASFITAGSASAQQRGLIASVPFNFAVGDRILPSGTYTITSDQTTPSLLSVRDMHKGLHVMTFGQPNESRPKDADVLVFHKVAGAYYLREVRSSTSSMNVQFPITKAEKKARAQVQEAGLSVNDPVLIALN